MSSNVVGVVILVSVVSLYGAFLVAGIEDMTLQGDRGEQLHLNAIAWDAELDAKQDAWLVEVLSTEDRAVVHPGGQAVPVDGRGVFLVPCGAKFVSVVAGDVARTMDLGRCMDLRPEAERSGDGSSQPSEDSDGSDEGPCPRLLDGYDSDILCLPEVREPNENDTRTEPMR